MGVIDTGIDYTHPDLAANIWTNPGEIAGNGIDDDANGFVDDVHGYDFANNDGDPMDDYGHGTATVAAGKFTDAASNTNVAAALPGGFFDCRVGMPGAAPANCVCQAKTGRMPVFRV